MESKLAQQVRRDLLEDIKRMTPEQRLQAFINHCQLSMQLFLAGERYRAEKRSESQ